ncbi:hypothetical protein ACHAWF_001262, partial [Thalassiosira exigua]
MVVVVKQRRGGCWEDVASGAVGEERKTPSRGAEDDAIGGEEADAGLPYGIYSPPSAGPDPAPTDRKDGGGASGASLRHGGCVRIVDAKGKFFQCGFSRPVCGFSRPVVGSAAEDDAPGGGRKRNLSRREEEAVGEERLHPEEAAFLHMRGLLRVESVCGDSRSAMSARDLLCGALPECGVPLAAYLAYAHLRSQGYILTRYTDPRMGLLSRLTALNVELRNDDRSVDSAKPNRAEDVLDLVETARDETKISRGEREPPCKVKTNGDNCNDASQNHSEVEKDDLKCASSLHESAQSREDHRESMNTAEISAGYESASRNGSIIDGEHGDKCTSASQNRSEAENDDCTVKGVECENSSHKSVQAWEVHPESMDTTEMSAGCESTSNANTNDGDHKGSSGGAPQNDKRSENGDRTRNNPRFRSRQLRLELSDDVATAPPPCVSSPQNADGPKGPIRLAYYAYNPNARFRRSDPGPPDFGVA